jgi:hypothetical protein
MPIDFAVPPEQSLEALRSGISRLSGSESATPVNSFASVAKVDGEPSYPHQVYSIRLDQLTSDIELWQLQPVSWRYFIKPDPHPTFAEVNIKADGPIHKFAHCNTGLVSTSTFAAIQRFSNDPRLLGSYELRMLRIVDLNFAALWFADKSARNDMFVPLRGANLGLDSEKLYSRQDLLSELGKAIPIARVPGSLTSS